MVNPMRVGRPEDLKRCRIWSLCFHTLQIEQVWSPFLRNEAHSMPVAKNVKSQSCELGAEQLSRVQ